MAKKSNAGADEIRDLVEMFGMLGDETRLGIVCRLVKQEQNVGSLCKVMKINQPTMSHHLGLLRMGRIVVGRRQGKQVIYSLNTDSLRDLMGQFAGMVRSKK